MRKYTSVAALALRLTWLRVLAIFAAVGGAQWFLFFRECMDEGSAWSFCEILDEYPHPLCNVGIIALALVLYGALAGSRGSRTAYTLRRLQISEGCSRRIFTLVFAGYFIAYLTFQLVLCFAFYSIYTGIAGVKDNLLFVDAMRSQHFHNLLPLYEPWGMVRNLVLILALAGGAALGGQNARNGRPVPLLMTVITCIAWTVCYPYEMASQESDMVFVIVALVCFAIDRFWTWRWMCNETD